MRVLPILFNADMVRAILEGRKSVTRRVIKNKDIINGWDCEKDGTPIAFIDQRTGDSYPPTYPCPYRPGDILYVRETWYKDAGRYMYRANYSDNEKFYRDGEEVVIKWHPSIHMPKEAARLFLRVTGVRVELLQDIDGLGAFDEGAVAEMPGACLPPNKPDGFDKWNAGKQNEYIRSMATSAYIAKLEFANRLIKAYAKVWDSTMPRKLLPLCGWSANPWVWVIEFERVSKEAAVEVQE